MILKYVHIVEHNYSEVLFETFLSLCSQREDHLSRRRWKCRMKMSRLSGKKTLVNFILRNVDKQWEINCHILKKCFNWFLRVNGIETAGTPTDTCHFDIRRSSISSLLICYPKFDVSLITDIQGVLDLRRFAVRRYSFTSLGIRDQSSIYVVIKFRLASFFIKDLENGWTTKTDFLSFQLVSLIKWAALSNLVANRHMWRQTV